MKEFTFRLSKANPADFWQSVQRARVTERIYSGKSGPYQVEFYESGDCFCVGVSHLILLPGEHRRLDIVRFSFVTYGEALMVTAEYSDHPLYCAYIAGLFCEIGKGWADAQPEINQVTSELMDADGLLEKLEAFTLDNSTVAHVLGRMQKKINSWEQKTIVKTSVHNRFADKVTREVEAFFELQAPALCGNKLIAKENYYVKYRPGLEPGDTLDQVVWHAPTIGLLVTADEAGADVKVVIEYQDAWRDLAVFLREKAPAPAANGGQVVQAPQPATNQEPDADAVVRYGTYRDLSLSEVREIVKRCRASSLKITEFHREYSHDKYSLWTLRDWLKKPEKFG